MTTLTLELSDDVIEKLQEKAQLAQMDLSTWIHTLIESSVDEDNDDDDIEFSKEEILNDIREGIIEVLAGDFGIPADGAMAQLRAELDNADNR